MNKFLSDVATTVISRGVVLCVGLGTGIVTARLLGPEGRGAYFLAITWIALGVQFGSLGGAAGVVWLRRHHGAAVTDLLGTSAFQAVVAGSVAALLTIGIAAVSGIQAAAEYRVWGAVVVATVAGLFFQLAANLMLADGRAGRYNVVQVLNSVFAGVLVSAAAWWFSAAIPVVYAAALAALAAAIVAGVLAAERGGGRWRVSPNLLRLGGGFAGRIFLTTAISFAAQRASIVVLARYADTEQVGYYSIAVQICDALQAIPASVGALLFPSLIAKGSLDWSRALRTMMWTTAVVALAAIVIALVAPLLLGTLFGSRFDAAVAVTHHLLPSVVALSACTIISQYVAASGAPVAAALPWALALVVGATWCAVVAPASGAQGAADGQVAANATALVGLWLLAQRIRRVHLQRSLEGST